MKPRRQYEQAVKAFEPYYQVKEENPEGKGAGPKRRTFVFVNNRLEGNAISTIAAMLDR